MTSSTSTGQRSRPTFAPSSPDYALSRGEDQSSSTSSVTPGFAERHGPTVLLFVGVCLILAAIAAVFTNHQLIAGGMSTTGVVAIITAAVLSRMVGPFKLLGLSGSLSRPKSELRIRR
jgi:hypothetical protein